MRFALALLLAGAISSCSPPPARGPVVLAASSLQGALDTIADVNASGLWPGKVVTEVAPAGPFWEAEPEHQDYLERIPNGYTCHFVRPGWKLPVRDKGRAIPAPSP